MLVMPLRNLQGEVNMVRSICQTVLVASLLCFFTGCGVDRCQIISHPSSTRQGDTISVLFSDIYIIISTTPTLSGTYARDSLHAGYGLPVGWSVLSSDYYIATGIRMSQMASLMSNPSQIMTLIQDSLAAYTARKSPMTADNGWSAYFTSRTFEAHNAANTDSIRVVASNIGQWKAYSSKISLSIPSGTKMDTGVALTALPISSTAQSQIKALFKTDSIWVKAIPIVCFASIIAGQALGTDTLFYYTKTDSISKSTSTLNFDKGDMTYAPININPNIAVRLMPFSRSPRALLRVSARPDATTLIEIGGQGAGSLSICDMAGKTIRRFDALHNAAIIWDRTTSTGVRVGTGTFVVRYESTSDIAAQAVPVVK
jgi:hypothetical protein